MDNFRFTNRSARYISAYSQGLSGSDAAWANRRYHGHRTLPPSMARMAQARGVEILCSPPVNSVFGSRVGA